MSGPQQVRATAIVVTDVDRARALAEAGGHPPAAFAVLPSVLRYSSILVAMARDWGGMPAVARLRSAYEQAGNRCQVHGHLPDPIVGLLGEGAAAQVAFGCPHCSGDDVRAMWEAEVPGVQRGVTYPCEECGALDGSVLDNGWWRCRRCGYPGQ